MADEVTTSTEDTGKFQIPGEIHLRHGTRDQRLTDYRNQKIYPGEIFIETNTGIVYYTTELAGEKLSSNDLHTLKGSNLNIPPETVVGVLKKKSVVFSDSITIDPNYSIDIPECIGPTTINLNTNTYTSLDNMWVFTIKMGDTEYQVTLPNIAWSCGYYPVFLKNTITKVMIHKVGETFVGTYEITPVIEVVNNE